MMLTATLMSMDTSSVIGFCVMILPITSSFRDVLFAKQFIISLSVNIPTSWSSSSTTMTEPTLLSSICPTASESLVSLRHVTILLTGLVAITSFRVIFSLLSRPYIWAALFFEFHNALFAYLHGPYRADLALCAIGLEDIEPLPCLAHCVEGAGLL